MIQYKFSVGIELMANNAQAAQNKLIDIINQLNFMNVECYPESWTPEIIEEDGIWALVHSVIKRLQIYTPILVIVGGSGSGGNQSNFGMREASGIGGDSAVAPGGK